MYIVYVDESGDIGLNNSPTKYFILSGLVIHELRWRGLLDGLLDFRRAIRSRYGLKVREEIHAAAMIRGNGLVTKIHKSVRLQILKHVIDFQARNQDLSIVNVVVDKSTKTSNVDIFELAWTTLLQRFGNTIQYNNFPGPRNQTDYGIVVADNTDVPKLKGLLRRLQVYNPVPNVGGQGYRMLPLQSIIKDPIHRDSGDSYFIQLADVNAYFLQQKLRPASYIKSKGAHNYFDRLNPILCKVASRTDPLGIVRI